MTPKNQERRPETPVAFFFSCDILDNYRTIVEEYCKVADVLLRVI